MLLQDCKLRPISLYPTCLVSTDLTNLTWWSSAIAPNVSFLSRFWKRLVISLMSRSRSRSRSAPAWWSGRGSHSPAPTPPWSSGPAPTTFDQPTNCYLKHVELSKQGTNTPLNRQLLLYKREQSLKLVKTTFKLLEAAPITRKPCFV